MPDLKDGNRNHAIKKLAEELSSSETMARLKEIDPESKNLINSELIHFIVNLENGTKVLCSRVV